MADNGLFSPDDDSLSPVATRPVPVVTAPQVQAPPPPPTQSRLGGFASMLQRILPAVGAVSAGIAAANHNPVPAEMIQQQQRWDAQQARQRDLDEQTEQERQLRISVLGQQLHDMQEEARVNPPRSPQEVMDANLKYQKALADIDREKKAPSIIYDRTGAAYYSAGPGVPAQPVMVPNTPPSNVSEISPGAGQGPVSPQVAQEFLRNHPTHQLFGPTAEEKKPPNPYEDFASDDAARQARAREWLNLQTKNKEDVKNTPPGVTLESKMRLQLDALKTQHQNIESDIKDLKTGDIPRGPEARKKQQDMIAAKEQQLQNIVRQENELNGQLNPVSSTRTADGVDTSKLKKGDTVYINGQPKIFDHVEPNGKIAYQK